MPVVITDVTNLQQLSVQVSGPAPATTLVVVTGTAQLPNFSSTNAQGGIKKETFTLLAGPTLTSAQFVRATAMASPATFRPTGQSVLVSVAQADADFDDDSGKTQIRIEAEILGDITLVAVAFQAMILAALP